MLRPAGAAALAVSLLATSPPAQPQEAPADAANGRRIVLGGGDGNCLLCHAVPGAGRPAGNIGPSLAGVGGRLTRDEIRDRIADASRFNRDTVMPPYGRTRGLHQVAPLYRGQALLTPREIEDAAAFLATLR